MSAKTSVGMLGLEAILTKLEEVYAIIRGGDYYILVVYRPLQMVSFK